MDIDCKIKPIILHYPQLLFISILMIKKLFITTFLSLSFFLKGFQEGYSPQDRINWWNDALATQWTLVRACYAPGIAYSYVQLKNLMQAQHPDVDKSKCSLI
jgi:hypothetical protein